VDSDLTREQNRSREATLQRSLDEPMPRELTGQIQDLIEPHTMNMYLKHGDVMTCIDVAFPVIRDWLRAHPEDLAAR
jgi:hypothetical protein